MTNREKAIVSAYTGVTMLTGDKFQIFHKYIEDIMGRPVWTHELGDESVWNEIKEKSKDDFIEICKTEDKTEERPQGEWIIDGHHYKCSRCGKTLAIMFSETDDDDLIGCPFCLADMRVKDELGGR